MQAAYTTKTQTGSASAGETFDPRTGRFTAPDPIGLAGGDEDVYGYCLDDPVNGVDPVGLETKGRDLSLSASGFGGRIEVGIGYHKDENGGQAIVPHFDYGASSEFGLSGTVTHQDTTAESVNDLGGTAMILGGGINAGGIGGGLERIEADSYQGSTVYGDVSAGLPVPVDVHVTRQHSFIWHPLGFGKKE